MRRVASAGGSGAPWDVSSNARAVRAHFEKWAEPNSADARAQNEPKNCGIRESEKHGIPWWDVPYCGSLCLHQMVRTSQPLNSTQPGSTRVEPLMQLSTG